MAEEAARDEDEGEAKAPRGMPVKRPSLIQRASEKAAEMLRPSDTLSVTSVTTAGGTRTFRSSISQRASQLGSSLFSKGGGSSTGPIAEDEDFAVKAGDFLETLEQCTVRSGESFDAPTVAELPRGVTLTVQFLGESSRRIKVATGTGIAGWISLKTRKNQPLVARSYIREGDFEVGGLHEVKSIGLTMRTGEPLNSEALAELATGMKLKILELGCLNRRRALVEAGDHNGWVSMSTNEGQYLIGKVGGAPAMQDAGRQNSRGTISLVGSTGENPQIKELLDAARENNLTGVKAKLEGGRKSILGSLNSSAAVKINVNSSDIRGKTALMYSSAFGHAQIVEYLLGNQEINVNGTDDMQKTALHHASKPGGSQGPSIVDTASSSSIIKMLIEKGARLEAKDHNDHTALMLAACHGASTVLWVLLEAKADPSKKNDQGSTAFDLAIQADWPRSFLDLFGPNPPRGTGGGFDFVNSEQRGLPDDGDAPTAATGSSSKPPTPSVETSAAADAGSPAQEEELPVSPTDSKTKGLKKKVLVKKPKAKAKSPATPGNEGAAAEATDEAALAEACATGNDCIAESPADAADAGESPSSPGSPAKKKILAKRKSVKKPVEGDSAKDGKEEDDTVKTSLSKSSLSKDGKKVIVKKVAKSKASSKSKDGVPASPSENPDGAGSEAASPAAKIEGGQPPVF